MIENRKFKKDVNGSEFSKRNEENLYRELCFRFVIIASRYNFLSQIIRNDNNKVVNKTKTLTLK